jgi:XapX domain-containing protein
MTGYFVSFVMGLAVGVAYALVQVGSPAPPVIALVGLLGILMGEHAVGLAKPHLAPSAQTSTGEVHGASEAATVPAFRDRRKDT